MQSSEWHDAIITMNEMQLVFKKISDFEAVWRTSEMLTQWCSESSSLSVSQQRSQKVARIGSGVNKAAGRRQVIRVPLTSGQCAA
jgi:hypothetical protein